VSSTPSYLRHSGQVLEHEGGVVDGQPVDEGVGDLVEAAPNAVPLPPTFSAEQEPTDASVVGLLPTQVLPSSDVDRLDPSDLGEQHSDEGGPLWGHPHSVERRLVGVERDQGGRRILWFRSLGVDRDRPMQPQVHLGEAMAGVREHSSLVVGRPEPEGGPLAAAERDSELSRLRVEMEAAFRQSDEWGADVRNSSQLAPSQSPTVSRGEGEGDLGRCYPDATRDPCLQGPGSSKSGELAPRGDAGGERIPEALVDEETEVVHEEADRRRVRLRVNRRMRDVRQSRRVADAGCGAGVKRKDEGPTGVHETGGAGRRIKVASAAEGER
jgi:hypothetical protein